MVQWLILGAISGIVSAVFGVLMGWVLVPPIVERRIDKNVILTEGSEQFERWRIIPQPLEFKVYLFNVTNARDVENGALPNVQEIGPYIYNQYRVKTIKSISNDRNTVSYTQQQTFHFNAKASAPLTEQDPIVVLNVHMNACIQIAELLGKQIFRKIRNRINDTLEQTPIVRTMKHVFEEIRGEKHSIFQVVEDKLPAHLSLINSNMKEIFGKQKSVFLSTTPEAYLFKGIPFCQDAGGVANFICKIIEKKESKSLQPKPDGSIVFSFFNNKNTTHEGLFEVFTGVNNVNQLTEIYKIDHKSTISVWENNGKKLSVCNMMNGTDSGSFPPHLKAEGSLYIFSTDICRSVQVFYERKSSYRGIPTNRYVIGENFLNEIGPQYSNECFCVDSVPNVPKHENGCLYKGAIDLTACQESQSSYRLAFKIQYFLRRKY